MERDFKKDLIEIDAAIKHNKENENTFTVSVLQRAKAIIMEKWIPRENATPDEQQEVLATDGKYVYLVEYDSDYGYGEMDGITAWMPLPEPYRPEN